MFNFWLDTLIALKGPDILWMKGIVHVEGLEWPFVFHGIDQIFDAQLPLKSWSGKDTTSRFAVIARDIDKGDLKTNVDTVRAQVRGQEVLNLVRLTYHRFLGTWLRVRRGTGNCNFPLVPQQKKRRCRGRALFPSGVT